MICAALNLSLECDEHWDFSLFIKNMYFSANMDKMYSGIYVFFVAFYLYKNIPVVWLQDDTVLLCPRISFWILNGDICT